MLSELTNNIRFSYRHPRLIARSKKKKPPLNWYGLVPIANWNYDVVIDTPRLTAPA
jgi:hypothetical protein